MKKIFLLLAITSLSVSCMNKYEDSLQELGDRVDKLEQKVPTIEQQITAIQESISLLEEVDKALKAKDEELSNADSNLERLISELKQYVNNEINSTKSWAEASLFTLQKYNSAVSSLAKLEQSIASNKNATSKEISDAISDMRTSFQKWVGEQLSGYYTIAKADAEFAALRQSAENGDEKLQGEIDNLETEIAKSATDLTEAYQKAIEEAINDYNGVITAALDEELEEVNKRLDEELAAINAKLAALEAQIGKNAEEIAKLLARIQSLSYIHKYADGKATMRKLENLRHAVLQFEVTPKESVTAIAKTWKDAMSAKGVCIIDDYKEFEEDMPILKFEADEKNGIISVTISGENLPDWTFVEKPEIQVILTISDGATAFTTDYISMAIRDYGGYDELIIPNNEIWYITSDEQPITIDSNTSFNTKVLSNTYDNEFGRIVTDGEITSLAYNAFADPDLLSVYIPDGVNDIADGAFLSKSIIEFKGKHASNDGNYISVNNRLISVVAGLTTFEVPEHITSIGGSAFADCTSLTSVTILDSITEIGGSAFEGCSSLKDTYVNITDLAAYATSNPMHEIGSSNIHLLIDGKELTELVIPESVIEIGGGAFADCTSLKSVTIPDSVTSIGEDAFYDCSLTSVTIPASVTKIGGSAFSGCTGELIINSKIVETDYSYNNYPMYNSSGWLYGAGFTKLTIGDGITSIGKYAFDLCSSLTSITIPNSVTSIGKEAFRWCSSLTSVTIGNGVTSIGDDAFYKCSSLTSVTIPDSVTKIGGSAFSGCTGELIINSSCLGLFGGNFTKLTIGDSVTEIGNSAFSSCSSLTSVTIPDSVTKIGEYAFSRCSSLTSVTIPDSVTSIGDYAFLGCKSLKDTYINITDLAAYATSNPMHEIGSSNIHLLIDGKELTELVIPESITSIGGSAFEGCSSLTSVTIPDSVTKIGEYAFYRCSSLTSVTIPDSVTSIGYSAFYGCSSLTSVYISDLLAWCKIAFGINSFGSSNANPLSGGANLYLNGSKLTDITIPSEITAIQNYTFSGCSSLTSVTIPDSVTSIGDYAFYDCTSLTSVTIPDSVTSIGDYAFYGCTSLTSITIPRSVTSIGNSTFSGCTSLTSITIPRSVTSIGDYAFYDCSSLTSITIPGSVTEIGYNVFYGCCFEKDKFVNNSSLDAEQNGYWGAKIYDEILSDGLFIVDNTVVECRPNVISVTIPDGVTSIGDRVFRDCTSLTSITISDSVTSIGNWAFSGCTSLTSITIPDSVTSIGVEAFNNCTSLTSVTIGNGVTKIGVQAFYGCTGELTVNCNIPNGSYSSNNYHGAFTRSEFTKVTIGNGVTEIGEYGLAGCTSLTSVTIGNGVTSIGKQAFADCTGELIINSKIVETNYTSSNYPMYSSSGWLYGSKFTKLTIGDNITKIGDYVFYKCSILTSVTIGNSVTSIGGNAFYLCSSLTSVDISDLSAWCKINFRDVWANPLYYAKKLCLNGSEITDLTIPSGITEIKAYAFYNYSILTSVTIPDSVTLIRYSAFDGCSSLTSVTIGNGVTSIIDYAFYGCSSLTSVTIPDSVTSIGDYAFSGCSNISIGHGVTGIGEYAFKNCTGELLINCNIPDESSSQYSPFRDSKFTKVTFGDSVTSIGDYAFAGCSSLPSSITIPDSVTSIGDNAFRGCSSLTSVTIGNGVTSIGKQAFVGCTGELIINSKIVETNYTSSNYPVYSNGWLYGSKFTKLTIGDNITKIGDYAFRGCIWLTSITIPDSVTEIGHYAFHTCRELTSITIPNSVTWIGKNAFTDCSRLTSVYCKPATPPAIYHYYSTSETAYQGSFPFNSGMTIYVPRSAYDSYAPSFGFPSESASPHKWYNYRSYVQPYDFE